MSACGTFSVVVIAMIGNPFSPDESLHALDRASLNVAIHANRTHFWSFEERSVQASALSPASMSLGASSVSWEGDRLVIHVNERTTPGNRPLRGRIEVVPELVTSLDFMLDEQGLHHWWPMAPRARVIVAFDEPKLMFEGHGYADANAGAVPLERTFAHWTWARARTQRGAFIGYDITSWDGRTRTCAMAIDPRGARGIEGLVRSPLRSTWWLLSRTMLADARTRSRVTRALEDGPFYARALVSTCVEGEDIIAMHETLSGDRLRRPIVKRMLRYRMGRAP